MNNKLTSLTVITTVITTYLMLFNYHMLDFLNSIIIYEYTLNQLIFMALIIAAIGGVIGMFGFTKQSEEQVKSMLKNITGMTDTEMNRFENSMKKQYKNRLESAVPGLSKLENLKNAITNPTANNNMTISAVSQVSVIMRSQFPEPAEFIKYFVSVQNSLVLDPKSVLATETTEIQTPLKIIQAIPFSDVTETKKKSKKSKIAIIMAAIIIAANLAYIIYTGGLSFLVH